MGTNISAVKALKSDKKGENEVEDDNMRLLLGKDREVECDENAEVCVENAEDAVLTEEEKPKEEKCEFSPLSCFGMEKEKTENWLLGCVRFWYCIMSFVWFLFGATTYAPVIYIRKKISPICENKVSEWFFAVFLYLLPFMIAIGVYYSRVIR